MLEAERILQERGIPYRLIELSNRARTAAEVARYSMSDVNADEICKTIIMRDGSKKCYAFLLIGTDRVDLQKASRLTGMKLSIANFDEVLESTGTEPGAVCPLTLHLTLTIDKHVTALQRVNFGSGDYLRGIEMKTIDLLHIVKHTIADVAK